MSESLAYIKNESTIGCEILFLDATDSVLVQRYKESLRHHPLAPKGMPLDGIRLERQMLEELKDSATLCLDTSSMKPAAVEGEDRIAVFASWKKHTLR